MKNPFAILSLIFGCLAIVCSILHFTIAYQVKIKCSEYGLHVISLKPRYRSLTFEWADGYTHKNNKQVFVLLNNNGSFNRYGHYWIPKVRWFDMKDVDRIMGQTNSIITDSK